VPLPPTDVAPHFTATPAPPSPSPARPNHAALPRSPDKTNHAEQAEILGQVDDAMKDVVKAELVKQREEERELENERPCVFKSISPVSTRCRCQLTLGLEQREPDPARRKDPQSAGIVSARIEEC
jgi:glutamine amidotransferase